ncbi:hypothetical protein Lal_00001224 [Lupinus albus]|nr:hypothetical protein Lal_00001224 [Lupinus albus]
MERLEITPPRDKAAAELNDIRVGNSTKEFTITVDHVIQVENAFRKTNQKDFPILQENVIIADNITNDLVAKDMEIVGRFWADREDEQEYEEEYTEVLSKSQKKKLKNKGHSERIHFTRREPMISFESVNSCFWSDLKLKLFGVNDRGPNLPSLWGLCNINLCPTILVSASQHISFSIQVNNKLLQFCAIYASTNYLVRRQLWQEVQSIMLVNPGPWCCIGNFNVVIGAHECRSSTLPARLPIEEFKHFIEVGNLISLPTRGVDFTWSNRRRGVALTEKRLDISLCNEDWLHAWNQVSCCSLPRLSSDHHPIMFCSSSSDSIRKSAFRFHKMWLHNLDCRRVVSEAWRVVVHGCPMFVLSHKLRMLKKDLRHWNIHVFGDVHQRVKNAYNAVEVIQTFINESGLDAELLNQENMAQNDLLQALMVEETFWMEKTRLNWHLHGDRNTSFFHKVTKRRQVTKSMTLLKDGERILTSQVDIDSENNMLTTTPTDDEIKSAIFAMNGDGAPSLDGFGGCFYQSFWDIVGQDVCNSLAWEMMSSNQDWAIFYRHRFGNKPLSKYYKSSIWPGIRDNWSLAKTSSIWLIGNGRNINFWTNNWMGIPLVDHLQIPEAIHYSLKAFVSDFLHQSNWVFLAALAVKISDHSLPRINTDFKFKILLVPHALIRIKFAIALSGNSTNLCSRNSIKEFSILRSLNITINHSKAPEISEVICQPPSSACFANYLDIQDAMYAEFHTAILAIELATQKGWKFLWIECDSTMVVDTFNESINPPWKLWNRWLLCKNLLSSMRFKISHIYRKGNSSADKLANYGILTRTFTCRVSVCDHLLGSVFLHLMGSLVLLLWHLVAAILIGLFQQFL